MEMMLIMMMMMNEAKTNQLLRTKWLIFPKRNLLCVSTTQSPRLFYRSYTSVWPKRWVSKRGSLTVQKQLLIFKMARKRWHLYQHKISTIGVKFPQHQWSALSFISLVSLFFVIKSKSADYHRLSRMKAEDEEEMLRVPIILAIIKLLQALPEHSLHSHLPG